ncbi:hypothetical protein CEC48_03645 [Pseudomonas sp. K2I15]|nr:hypothetical protein CEC48_03645 [Pseudomonas sp. K2I15]
MLMMKFGQAPTNMFRAVNRVGEGYDVIMKDGYALHLSDRELQRTGAASRFTGHDGEMIKDANFALAVFVKRKQLSSADGGVTPSFDAVLSHSLEGETTFNMLKGMGMAAFMHRVSLEDAKLAAFAVMETNSFGSALVHNEVAHGFGRKLRVDRSHLYVLSDPDKPDVKPRPVVDSAAGRSIQRNAQKPTVVLTGFDAVERKFGEFFDLSSHASVIKMMMMRFGQSPADMFEKLVAAGDGYDITMRDGFELHLSAQELTQTTEASRFAGSEKGIMQDANFMLAAYAKRKQIMSTDPAINRRFDSALAKTLNGDSVYNVLKGMGMIGFLRIVPPSKIQEKGAVSVVDGYHGSGAFVLDGVKHRHGNKEAVGRVWGYMLAQGIPAESTIDSAGKTAKISDVPIGVQPANIWSGFYQGFEGNCVTVSAIKAAMMKYGQNPLGIYKSITETTEGYSVTMRDSCTVRLTHAELEQAKKSARFAGDDKGMLRDAIFLYAVSAKRAQMENHEFRAAEGFETAMETLNDGESPGDALRRLGLFAFTRGSSVQELAEGVTGTLANFQHSVVVVGGVFDDYGFKRQLKTSEWMRNDGQALKLV